MFLNFLAGFDACLLIDGKDGIFGLTFVRKIQEFLIVCELGLFASLLSKQLLEF